MNFLSKKPHLQVQLERVSSKWRAIAQKYNRIICEIIQIADEQEIAHQIRTCHQAFQENLLKLQNAANQPKLIIATTGTTSSGKSTLLNALIGVEILPSGVQEMSAGTVIVEHGQGKFIEILATKGATWQTGRWENQTPAEIRTHIKNAINSFRDAKKENPKIETLQIKIVWPTAMGNNAEDYGLPEGIRLSLIDLPGLKSVQDSENAPIIKKQISQAFCLIVYNSEETDSDKRKKLIDDITEEICALRTSSTSLTRMSLILNRIDAFIRDDDSHEKMKEFVTETLAEVQNSLREKIPEEAAEIEKIQPIKFSAKPALLAICAQKNELNSTEEILPCLEKINNDYGSLLNSGYLKKLNRDPGTWSKEQRQEIITEMLEKSGFETLRKHLGNQLKDNLPALVLGLPVQKMAESAQDLYHAMQSFKESLEGDIHDIKAKEEDLRALETQLFTLIKEAKEKISVAPLKKNATTDGVSSPGAEFRKWASQLIKEADLPTEKEAPFRQLEENILTKPFNKIYDICDKFFKDEKPSFTENASLQKALQNLKNSEYDKFFENGGDINAETETAEKIQNALNDFKKCYVESTESLLKKALNDQGKRISIILQECADALLVPLREKTKHILEKMKNFSGLSNVFDSHITIPAFDLNENLPSSSEALMHRIEKFEEERTKQTESSFLLQIITLGFFGNSKTIHYIEEVERKIFIIPSLGEIAVQISDNKDMQDALFSIITNYLENVAKAFEDQLSARLEKTTNLYQQAFDETAQLHETIREKKTEQLERLLLNEFKSDIDDASDWKNIAEATSITAFNL